MADKKKTTKNAPEAEPRKKKTDKTEVVAEPRKKADVIIEKLDCLLSSSTETVNRADKAVANSMYISRQNSEIYEKTLEENAVIKQQIKYIAAQSQTVFDRMSTMIADLSAKIDQLQGIIDGREDLTTDKIAEEVSKKLDYAKIAEEVTQRLDYVKIADEVAQKFDYGKIASSVSAVDYAAVADEVAVRINYDTIVDNIEDLLAEHLAVEEGEEVVYEPAPEPAYFEAEEVGDDETVEIDYDLLADKVAEKVLSSAPAQQEVVSADYIASKVAEQIVVPQLDYDAIADAVFDRLYEDDGEEDVAVTSDEGEEYTPDEEELAQFTEEEDEGAFDYEKLSDLVVEKLTATDEEYSDEEYDEFDYERLADLVAERLFPAEEEGDGAEEEEQVEFDYDKLAGMVAEKIAVPAVDEENIANLVAEKLTPADEELAEETAEEVEEVEEEPAEVDYDKLAEVLAAKITVPEVNEENIANLVADKLLAADEEDITEETAEEVEEAEEEPAEVDYDKLADVLAAKLVLPAVSEENIANLVADKLMAADEAQVTEESAETAEASYAPEDYSAFDYDKLAELVAVKLSEAGEEEEEEDIAEADEAEAEPVGVVLSEETMERIVDEISKKVCEFLPDEYDIVVDDAGCEELAAAISEKLDKSAIAGGIAEQILPVLESDEEEADYDEIAAKMSEKLVMPTVNEDELAEKAAAVLSNYMPEIDTDEMCDRISAAVIAALPAAETIDYEAISNSVSEKIAESHSNKPIDYDAISVNVSEKLIEAQNDSDYDIIIDEEGIERITQSVAERVGAVAEEKIAATDEKIAATDGKINAIDEKIAATDGKINAIDEKIAATDGKMASIEEKIDAFESQTGERFDKIESDVSEIKDLLLSGAKAAEEEIVIAEAAEAYEEQETIEDIIEEPAEEAEEPAEEQAEELPAEEVEEEPAEEELVTVSDVVGEEEAEEAEEGDEVLGEIVEDIDEQPVGGEVMPDGIEGISSSGVDFANMMKYNRSFIARIIQGSDDVKRFYGATKTALLSYKKVNSSVAWGAERFNKGRETIAKFKIRGKTLCLYLALNPNDYKTSVYHQVDVSNNKSMATTPMMVKIKSPLGVKKAIRLIDDMLLKRGAIKQNVIERDYVAMYPYETIEELIEDGLVKDVSKNK